MQQDEKEDSSPPRACMHVCVYACVYVCMYAGMKGWGPRNEEERGKVQRKASEPGAECPGNRRGRQTCGGPQRPATRKRLGPGLPLPRRRGKPQANLPGARPKPRFFKKPRAAPGRREAQTWFSLKQGELGRVEEAPGKKRSAARPRGKPPSPEESAQGIEEGGKPAGGLSGPQHTSAWGLARACPAGAESLLNSPFLAFLCGHFL